MTCLWKAETYYQKMPACFYSISVLDVRHFLHSKCNFKEKVIHSKANKWSK